MEEVNGAFSEAAAGPDEGHPGGHRRAAGFHRLQGQPASSIVDALSTMVMGGNMVKVLSWYDNEWGYSCRVSDLAAYIAGK